MYILSYINFSIGIKLKLITINKINIYSYYVTLSIITVMVYGIKIKNYKIYLC